MWNFGPVIDIGLQPLWARHYETFGDEPYLVSIMSRAAVRGMQRPDLSTNNFKYERPGQNTTLCGTTLKHWIGYSMPDSGADRTDATVPEWVLQRFFLPAFAGVLAESPASVMLNSGSMNKIPGHSDKQSIEGLMRSRMKFQGFTLSDYEDVQNLFAKHKIAPSLTEATRIAFDSGLDMAMVPWDMTIANELLKLVQAGTLSQARIDMSVKRILDAKEQLGLFENPFGYPDNAASVGSETDRAIARRMVEEGATLLKNQNNVLPLPANGAGKKILITGPTASSLSLLSGGWTWQWQGPLSENLFAGRGTTIVQGVEQVGKPKGYTVRYILGHGLDGPAGNRGAAIAEAAQSDYIIVCLGEKTYAEMLYNINNLELGSQSTFVADLKATGKPVILVMVQGRPRLATPAFAAADAILYTYLPGPDGGIPIANILFGEVNPSGRLPFSYPSATGQLSLFVDRWKHTPLFPLGYGLSFTTFAYSELTVTPASYTLQLPGTSPLTISVRVRNTGQRGGKEVVRVMMEEPQGPQNEKVFMMKRFTKVFLPAQGSVVLSFKLMAQDFRWLLRAPSGASDTVRVRVGSLEGSFKFQTNLDADAYPITMVPDFDPDNMTRAEYPPKWLAPQSPPPPVAPVPPPAELPLPVGVAVPSVSSAPPSEVPTTMSVPTTIEEPDTSPPTEGDEPPPSRAEPLVQEPATSPSASTVAWALLWHCVLSLIAVIV
jgi:beta-glucosidase